MNEYVKLTGRGGNTHRPVDNMKFNGRYLDDVIDGYLQLHVAGRQLVSRRLAKTEIPARAGAWFDNVVDDTRQLTIKYQMKAETSSGLRDAIFKLNKALRSDGPVSIVFDDEPDFEYFGVYVEGSNEPETSLSFVGEFQITCLNPAKFKKVQSSTGAITLTEAEKVLPRKITLTVSGTVDTVEVINGNKKLVLKGSYKAGDVITFDFKPDDFEIFLGSRLILFDLQLYSPLEDFWLRNGDTVTAKNATITKIEWRDERL